MVPATAQLPRVAQSHVGRRLEGNPAPQRSRNAVLHSWASLGTPAHHGQARHPTPHWLWCWWHPGFLCAAAVLSSKAVVGHKSATASVGASPACCLAQSSPDSLLLSLDIRSSGGQKEPHRPHPMGPAAPWPRTAPLLLLTTLPSSSIP